MARGATIFIVAVLMATVPARAVAFDITACGQTVPRNQVGVLQVDLNCPLGSSTTSTTGVSLESKATLDLNSHTLNGASFGVNCVADRCTVRGPGVISGSSRHAIVASTKQVNVGGVTFSNIPGRAIRMNVPDVTRTKINVENSTLDNVGQSLAPNTSHLATIMGGKIKLENVSVTNCAIGAASGRKLKGTNVTLTGNHFGVTVDTSANMTNLTATGHDELAISVQKAVVLKDSTLADNGQAGDGVDILSAKIPKLRNSTCERSQVCLPPPVSGPPCEPQPATWGVCTNDF